MDQSAESLGDTRRTIAFSTIAKALPIILGVTAIFGAAGILLSRYQDTVYEATSRVFLSTTRPFDPLGGDNFNTSTERFLANEVQRATSGPVLAQAEAILTNDRTVAQANGTILPTDDLQPIDAAALAASVTVTADSQADILLVTGRAPTAVAAEDRANAVAFGYADVVRADVAARASRATTAVQAAGATSDDPGRVIDTVSDITALAAVYDDNVDDVDQAEVPTAPVEPNPLRNGFLAAALGFLLTTGLILLRRGEPVADRQALVETAGAPVIGVVPVPLPRLSKRKAPPLPQARDFSMALVALGYVVADTSGVVMVTGVRRDSDAATVALGLAAAAAEQQRRVVVVDADTSEAELVRHSGQEGPELPVGALSDAGTPEHRAVTELVRLRPASGEGSVHLASVMAGDAAGGGAEAVRQGLQRLVDSFDMVVLHAGPLATDPMAFALLRETSVLIAVVEERAHTGDLLALREKLELAGASCDGLVLTRAVSRRRGPAPAKAAPPLPTTPASGATGAPSANDSDGRPSGGGARQPDTDPEDDADRGGSTRPAASGGAVRAPAAGGAVRAPAPGGSELQGTTRR